MSNSKEPQLKITPKMIVIGAAILIVYLLLKPTLEEQFGWKLPGFVEKPQVAQNDQPVIPENHDRNTRQKKDDADLSEFNDIIEQETATSENAQETIPEPVAEQKPASSKKMTGAKPSHSNPSSVTQPNSTQATSKKTDPLNSTKPAPNSNSKTNASTTPKSQPQPPVVKTQQPKGSPTPKIVTKPPLEKSTKSEAKEPALGLLKELSGKVYLSTAGLKYGPGSVDKHRLTHVMQHAEDNLEKPVHGVFSVDKKEILVLLDQAWELTKQQNSPQVRKSEERGRTSYIVDMKKPIGYVGGQTGKRRNNPKCYKIQLVVEDDEVITAYPTQ